ncbi:MAG: DUF721 domain-containing protein [Nitrosomonas sp.]|nr:DUF721 domain-containing protein [Nitrosomonas sp.]
MTSQNIKTYLRALGKNPEHADLFNRAGQIKKMERMFAAASIIPAHLSKHYKLGPFSNGQLTLLAENASVATKLKHISPSLLLKMQNKGWKVSSIKIMVQKPDCLDHTALRQKEALKSRKPGISHRGIASLSRFADTLPDSELKHSIQQLLKHKDQV